MKKILILVTVLIIIVIVGISSLKYLENNTVLKKPTATINNYYTFKLEVAKTQKEKEIGLSAKKTLEQNVGMLFPFEKPGYYPFWMKDMKFPIDIIFIKNARIVTIHKDVKPPKNPNDSLPIYNSKKPADTVLEINAGLSEKHNFKEKDLVKISNL